MPPPSLFSKKDQALSLAAMGFPVFPLIENSKIPAIKEWQKHATTDKAQIERWWIKHDYNIGVATGRAYRQGYLMVLDVDNKNGKNGSETLRGLEMIHGLMPKTFTVKTPTGGFHHYMISKAPVPNSSGKLGVGLDVRGVGGFVVAPGSVLEVGGGYDYH